MALATWETSAPVASHTAEIAFILEILWAKNAFAAYNSKFFFYTKGNQSLFTIQCLLFFQRNKQYQNIVHTSLESSDDHVFIVIILSEGIQWLYTQQRALTASCPSGVCSPPINTRSGFIKSFTAVPSAKNSGFDKTWRRSKKKCYCSFPCILSE